MSLQKLNAEFAPAPVRALLVDMDGVLFDTERRSLLSIIDIIGRQGLTITYDQLVERMGCPVRLCRADYANIKITTPEDVAFAEAILRERDDEWQ